jgi:5-methylcytosine-specific restriction endonuclease McrA
LIVLRNECKSLNYYSNRDKYTENTIKIRKARRGKIATGIGAKSRQLNIKSVLYNNQKGKCEYCNQELEEILNLEEDKQDYKNNVVIHHVVPKSENGSNYIKNLSLLHNNCHRLLHKSAGRPKYFQPPYRYNNIKGEKM